ncbi:hypothetical protein IPA_04445 [Ignicoccus pacificus DSM 13166]|uniref:Uncharacterized protein n=1 Tax=Ignicoccus pacificus DSM 13166 TaxID=940294 RepID=A0A977KB90_9CREN|nr:hypothetical protein IPA_04445 [Ignicoccus pacificus DSM 13166]
MTVTIRFRFTGCSKMDIQSYVNIIYDWTMKAMIIAWALVGLSWVIGWALRGAPIPILRIKKFGNSMIEDAVIAALWLALGSTVFFIIATIAKYITPNATINTTIPIKVR